MSRLTEYYRVESLQPWGTASYWDVYGTTVAYGTLKEARDTLATLKDLNPITKFRIIRMVKEIVE